MVAGKAGSRQEPLKAHPKPRGDSRPRLSGGAPLRWGYCFGWEWEESEEGLVELGSTGQPRAAVPT
jgi:hypothetical protein